MLNFHFFPSSFKSKRAAAILSEELRHKTINAKCRSLFTVNGKTLVYITPCSLIIFMATVLQTKLGFARNSSSWTSRRKQRRWRRRKHFEIILLSYFDSPGDSVTTWAGPDSSRIRRSHVTLSTATPLGSRWTTGSTPFFRPVRRSAPTIRSWRQERTTWTSTPRWDSYSRANRSWEAASWRLERPAFSRRRSMGTPAQPTWWSLQRTTATLHPLLLRRQKPAPWPVSCRLASPLGSAAGATTFTSARISSDKKFPG